MSEQSPPQLHHLHNLHNLQSIGKDMFQYVSQWLDSRDILALYCTNKAICAELDKIDREIWRDRIRFEIDKVNTIEDVQEYHTTQHMEVIWKTIDILANTKFEKSWRKVYLQYHLYQPKTFIHVIMAEYLQYRLIGKKNVSLLAFA